MNEFATVESFDRVVSIEMFEHMHNHGELMRRVAMWLKDQGKFFLHIFCHNEFPYFFGEEGAKNWMGRYFFTSGMMPSFHLPLVFQSDLKILKSWKLSGLHYARTIQDFLERMDANQSTILPILAKAYGEAEAELWYQRWRMFFMAYDETFKFGNGEEWLVGHYLFERH
jgi:cyclopropane-fatty-acyl-phospholipid synthase